MESEVLIGATTKEGIVFCDIVPCAPMGTVTGCSFSCRLLLAGHLHGLLFDAKDNVPSKCVYISIGLHGATSFLTTGNFNLLIGDEGKCVTRKGP